MKKHLLLTLVVFAIACSRLTNYREELRQHPFNREVIGKLPLFDSIRLQILANYDSFYFENKPDAYFGTNGPLFYYNYMPASSNLRGLPGQLYQNILPIMERIGDPLFDGFTILKDSSLVFWISSYRDQENHDLKIEEYLEWHPHAIHSLEKYPRKDTLLTDQWKLQIWYNQRKSLM